MTQSEAKNTDKILAGEYVLGLLSIEENTQFEARLETEPHLRRYYADWLEDFVTLTDDIGEVCLLYTSPSPRDRQKSRMPSSA